MDDFPSLMCGIILSLMDIFSMNFSLFSLLSQSCISAVVLVTIFGFCSSLVTIDHAFASSRNVCSLNFQLVKLDPLSFLDLLIYVSMVLLILD